MSLEIENNIKCPICFKGFYLKECEHGYPDLISIIDSLEQELNILKYETDKRIKDLTIDRDYFKRQNEYYKDRCKVLMNDYRTAIEIIKD